MGARRALVVVIVGVAHERACARGAYVCDVCAGTIERRAPSASASPTGRAVVFERTTSAFEPSPPGGVYGAPSPPPIASASSSYVEYAEKDLGALFGGADDGDDWISSSDEG